MCFATAAVVAGIAGAGISAAGSIESGAATANAQNYAAQVAANNSAIANQNAVHAEQAGAAQAEAVGLKGAETSGKIKAAQAASGIDVNTGSAVDVQSAEREKGQLDTETVLSNAELQAYGYRSQATNFQSQSGLDQLSADQATEGADIGAAGSVLSSASALGFKWSQLGNVGAESSITSDPTRIGSLY